MVARTLGPRWCSTELSLLSGLRRGERMEEIGRGRDESRRRAAGGSDRRGRAGARGAARRRGVAGGVACGAVNGATGGPNFAGGGGFGATAGGRARRARAGQRGRRRGGVRMTAGRGAALAGAVFKDAANFDLHTSMLNQAKLILKRCDGLPLAKSTIGGYLANKPKTATEWRKLNDGLSGELEINPQLKMIKTVLMRSYDGLSYHLKSSFLYLTVLPEDHIIRRKHVLRRWIAEGHSREMHHMTAEQVCKKHFDELVDRSMILPLDIGVRGGLHSFQLHDLIREICVAKAREENLVFILEEGCSLGRTRGGAIRHLTICSNWERDEDVMQRMLDLSHVRSLTVFGEWRSFFMSNKMRFLRVLDLEHTTGLRDHHLDKIGELLHLWYLSLRQCRGSFSLPDSLANLGQLQTLDVRGTRIWTLPVAVAKLQKLQYLHASGLLNQTRKAHGLRVTFGQALIQSCYGSVFDTCGCCYLFRHCQKCFHRPTEALRLARREGYILEDGVSCRYGLRYLYHYHIMLKEDGSKLHGLRIPRGISKLRSLHTLRVVNVARGKAETFEELRGLTQLRKLGVVGVDHTNMEMFWRFIAGHSRLQSLSVDHYKMQNVGATLDQCLGKDLSPPRCLESLKMHCKLVKVPESIHRLPNLFKLQLEETMLNQDAIEIIGTLPNLAVLRLHTDSFSEKHLRF
ncbi:disease resistance protein Pik-2-like [Miscanthus floridulus]|uniref:disease resistance protein Pik-2-like n=1 Tax=Miscanthus floridulus TaxID=154761 RepID=UPI0034575BFD